MLPSDPLQFVAKLRHILDKRIELAASFIRISLSSMRKKNLKALAQYIHENILSEEYDEFSLWFRMNLDIIETRIYKPPPMKQKKKITKYK